QGPASYTGDDVAELHLTTNQAVAALVLQKAVEAGARLAGPGEFTARAYFNGKLDLAQAEAVAEIIAAGNRTHLAAAERLLEGRLSAAVADIRSEMLELMSLIEAGLDFSEEGIDFITSECAAARMRKLADSLHELLAGSIRCEAMLDMPAVAICGPANAGKSSLLNALLGRERAIVSDQPATTRDVLKDVLRLDGIDCVIFDCAGLSDEPHGIIDKLAQAAARKAVASAAIVILCLDGARDDHSREERLFSMVYPAETIRVVTKSDLASDGRKLPDAACATSARTGDGIEQLRQLVAARLKTRKALENSSQAALTLRHATSVRSAIDDLARALQEIVQGSMETASMFLRSAWNSLAPIESEPIDDAILGQIFSRFCIGK
ncbi:MAG TPA: GTPase, partial [Sedimentisphaerales bacterium]|nr:GTPase [Sedimentisphaerales bacterium]